MVKPKILYLRILFVAALLTLLIFGVGKLFAAFGRAPMLRLSDVVIPVPRRQLLLWAGTLETVFSLGCLFVGLRRWPLHVQGFCLAILASSFLTYRVLSGLLDTDNDCPCLGTVASALHLSPQAANAISLVSALFLFAAGVVVCIGSYKMLGQNPQGREHEVDLP